MRSIVNTFINLPINMLSIIYSYLSTPGRVRYKFASFWYRNNALKSLQHAAKNYHSMLEDEKVWYYAFIKSSCPAIESLDMVNWTILKQATPTYVTLVRLRLILIYWIRSSRLVYHHILLDTSVSYTLWNVM